jgi:hypothetical protein
MQLASSEATLFSGGQAWYTAEVRELEFKTKSLRADPHPKAATEAPRAKLQVHLELKPSTTVVY